MTLFWFGYPMDGAYTFTVSVSDSLGNQTIGGLSFETVRGVVPPPVDPPLPDSYARSYLGGY